MKKFLLSATIIGALALLYACGPKPVSTVPTADNSQNSLDWAGTYSGMVPCADCEGIETVITLSKGNTFTAETLYKGKSTTWNEARGTFAWNDAGSTITLQPAGNATVSGKYLVGEGKLIQLDQQGNRITGGLADKYVLAKDNSGLKEVYWKLIELNGKPVVAGTGGPKEAYMVLKAGGGRVQGNGSCNGYFGTYTLEEPGRLRFSKMGSTMMACPNMETETGLHRVFEMADNYTMRNDTLSLNKARMAPLARFKAMPMPAKN